MHVDERGRDRRVLGVHDHLLLAHRVVGSLGAALEGARAALREVVEVLLGKLEHGVEGDVDGLLLLRLLLGEHLAFNTLLASNGALACEQRSEERGKKRFTDDMKT